MKKITKLATAAVAAASSFFAQPAAAYPIDCAILLCLAGGWPASVECAQAKAEFIRRITPWPVEPPLQIWRCPMRAASLSDDLMDPMDRLRAMADKEREPFTRIAAGSALRSEPAVLIYDPGQPLVRDSLLELTNYSSENGTADVDISSPVFDFVRSIRVFSVERANQRFNRKDNICIQGERIRIGSYSKQGAFRWRSAKVQDLPKAFKSVRGWDDPDCPFLSNRSVFVDWRDNEGTYGFQQVKY
jgi:hypothetical protein